MIDFRVNIDAEQIAQYVETVFSAIKKKYIIKYTKDIDEEGYGFHFGKRSPNENLICTDPKFKTATLSLAVVNGNFIKEKFNLTYADLLANYNDDPHHYLSTLQGAIYPELKDVFSLEVINGLIRFKFIIIGIDFNDQLFSAIEETLCNTGLNILVIPKYNGFM